VTVENKPIHMNIQEERNELIRRVELIEDKSLIKTINSLLDFAFEKQNKNLEESIARGLSQSLNDEGIAHENVMRDIREKYK
jgi:hypothetical protein